MTLLFLLSLLKIAHSSRVKVCIFSLVNLSKACLNRAVLGKYVGKRLAVGEGFGIFLVNIGISIGSVQGDCGAFHRSPRVVIVPNLPEVPCFLVPHNFHKFISRIPPLASYFNTIMKL